jgi:UDP:flavonoid glycosyltransferase YjiC (YdhE family)
MQPIADLHGPLALVYDGVFPYNGLIDAIRGLPISRASMVLRLRFKHGISRRVRARLRHFDEIILPGEAGEQTSPVLAGLPCMPVAPILYLDREELFERDEARRRLGIAAGRKAVYLQLGAGNIDDTSAALRAVLDTCRNRADTTVVHAVSPIAQSAPDLGNEYPNVVTLTHYPNAKCFKAFDLAISACGYNSFVELMHFGVPTIFVPNQRTVTDDQVGRARAAEAVGAARVALAADEIPGLLTDLMDSGKTAPMRICAASLIPKNGALAVAEHLLSDSRIEEST